MIGVWSESHEPVLAELPLSVRAAPGPAGAIAVVTGAAWLERARWALDDGARGLLIAEPPVAEPVQVVALTDETRRLGIPVVVERPRLEIGRPEPAVVAAIAAECAALDDEIGEILRDVVGWVRRLADAELELVDVDGGPRGWLALMVGGPVTASLLVDVLTGVEPGGYLRVAALGVDRIELEVDGTARSAGITAGSETGIRHLPAAFETPRRAALRRLLSHVADGSPTADLAELAADETLARAILAHHRI